MERQGHLIGSFQIMPNFSIFWVVLAVLLLSVSGWGSCELRTFRQSGIDYACDGGSIRPNYQQTVSQYCSDNVPSLMASSCGAGKYVLQHCPLCISSILSHSYYSFYCCGSVCEADSIKCVNAGKLWNSAGCNCVDPCGEWRSQCEAKGGTFDGKVITEVGTDRQCCTAICNLCTTKASEEQWEKKKYFCCLQNKAPPALNKCAVTGLPSSTKCGIETQFKSNEDNGACRDPNLSEDAAQSYYENCEPNGSSSSTAQSSSGEGGSSSSGDGGSSGNNPQYPEGCDECPWLDSILDTLTAQKRIVSDINECLLNAQVCLNLNPDTGEETVDSVYIDSTILNGIKDLFDSSLELDDEQVRILMSMDTTLLKMLVSDSATRVAIAGASSDIVSALSGASGAIQGGLVQVKNGIVSMDTAMKRRLDSLIKTIPSDILDSIAKYQDSALDRFDSVLFGKGVGFSLVDSLTDSIVKYFKVSNHYDSAYSVMFAEYDTTLKSIRNKMENMSFGLDASSLSFSVEMDFSPLGYGDTATVTLREDLHSMNDAVTGAINHIDTTVTRELQNLVERQEGFYVGATGYGVSGSSTLKGDLADIKGSVDAINERLGEGSYDTSIVYNGYLTGYDTSAVEFANNLGNLLTGATHDSMYNRIFMFGSSSSGTEYSYGIMNIDSAQQVLQASNDSTKSALADTMQNWFNELRKDFLLVNFDSAVIAPLGAKVPNTNTCPEECFRIDLSSLGGIFSGVRGMSWGLCEPRIGPLNVFQFIRLLMRIITALTCVYIGLWTVAGRKS